MDLSWISTVITALQPILNFVAPLAMASLFLCFIYWIIMR